MRRARAIAGLGCAAALASACGDSGDHQPTAGAARPVATTICGPVTYGGEGRPQLLIVNSGPLQGPLSDHGVQNAQAAKMVLAQRGWRAGKFTVGVQVCDEASAASPLPSAGQVRPQRQGLRGRHERRRGAWAGHVHLHGGDAADRQPGAGWRTAGHQHVQHLPRA